MRGEPDVRAFLTYLPLFQGLSAAEIGRLAEGTVRRRLRAGETLFRQGEPSTGVHAVVHGRIALTVQGPHGRERVSDIIDAGRSFGEAILFREKPYIVSAKALTDALVLHVAKQTVFAELERNPRFARRIIAGLSGRLHRLIRDLESDSLRSGTQRVIGYLLSGRGETEAPEGELEMTLPATKGVIASRLSLTQEHFSRILHDLSEKGLIAVEGREIRILDAGKLRGYHG